MAKACVYTNLAYASVYNGRIIWISLFSNIK